MVLFVPHDASQRSDPRTRQVWSAGAAEPSAWQADCWTTVAASVDSGTFALIRGRSGTGYFDDLAGVPSREVDPIPP
jgi:hypothetical protein